MVYLTNEELSSRDEKTTVLWYANPYIYYFPCHSDRGTVGYIHTVMSTALLSAMLFWRSIFLSQELQEKEVISTVRHKNQEKRTNITFVSGLVLQHFAIVNNK